MWLFNYVVISKMTYNVSSGMLNVTQLDWIGQCFTSPPTQYRLYGRRFFSDQKTQPTVSKY